MGIDRESPYFRDLFRSMHQNSHTSSWSLMSGKDGEEVVAHYGCNTWGLEQSLGSYISSFLTKMFETEKNKYIVWAYNDVGLILISELPIWVTNRSLYVANPVSQECVEIPSHAHLKEVSCPLGIATRTENGILLDYRVVLFDEDLRLLIYSSHTGLWSLNTVDSYPLALYTQSPISLHGSIHWIASTSHSVDVVVSIDLYATGTSSVQCRVTSFPDFGQHPKFNRSFSTCQGSLMYMNIIKVDEDKLCVWRLNSGEWQLVSEITPPFIDTGFEYIQLGTNPFDAKTVYFWSMKHQTLLSINLHNGKFVFETKLLSSINPGLFFHSVVLPQWLYRIPNTMRIV
ncbi:unnamed protein product [Arabidopsis lyrata]|uniref:F-box protein At3g26010-like beta-propeller domain-containing protein n=1 Tax=Arabidopsis lyrata subsp. lyrata TaxID=81972 RepID=D7LPR7_ARALL|nr:putative F-box protein At3g28280 [Arabidopsis lyrata subsp. lyrata]EFH53354.1 hypothetical protein ARALYDRAFT_905088 [Arabidopsis lyrata subsp. lyrata]CAH8267035.1 unnamed protein product [Arabidopsis lyrata]|eukprot:XP_002877095.1 putative F-box protein At3g28280 [Arabidopsis lyrata subsp. lyrata]